VARAASAAGELGSRGLLGLFAMLHFALFERVDELRCLHHPARGRHLIAGRGLDDRKFTLLVRQDCE
jgi:hypothetical protein